MKILGTLIVACFGLLGTSFAFDAMAADCGSGDEFASTRWSKYIELAQRFGCAPGDISNVAAVVEACNANALAKARINAGLVRDFNRAKYVQRVLQHPNRLTIAPRTGSIVGPLNKTWIFPELWDQDDVKLRFTKVNGHNRIKVELCRHQPDGRSIPLAEYVIRGRDPSGTTIDQTISNVRDSFISITINGREPTLDQTSYQLHVERPNQGELLIPRRSGARPVKGFSDLHTHMMSYFGFGGGFVHSNPFHPLSDCDGEHGALAWPFAGSDFEREHPSRTNARVDWPHHLDTAHQQMGVNQLKQAHNHGLSLIVLSAVSNEWASEVLIKDTSKDPDVPRSDMDAVRLQLRAAHAFASENEWFRIARDPWEARRIIADGDLAVILGVEISNLFPENQGDWESQLDELYDLGVRQMGLVHETDTDFAGAARHHGIMFRVANYLKELGVLSIFDLSPGSLQNLQAGIASFAPGPNPIGLKPLGREMLGKLASQRMLIDIDHSSRRARSDIIAFARDHMNNYPLIFTHTRYDALMPTLSEVSELGGYAVSEKEARAYGGFSASSQIKGTGEYMSTNDEILAVMLSGGVVGLRSGPNAIKTLMQPHPTNPQLRIPAEIPNGCPASSEGFAQLVAFGNRRLGVAQSMGSDIASPLVSQLGPRQSANESNATLACAGFTNTNNLEDSESSTISRSPIGGVAVPPPQLLPAFQETNGESLLAGDNPRRWQSMQAQFSTEGMKHIGMMPALLNDVSALGADINPLLRSAENVLRTWERAWDDNRQELDLGEYWAMMELPVPSDFVGTVPSNRWQVNKLYDNNATFGAWQDVLNGALPWQYTKFADFNGDGRSDVIRRTADGRWLLMYMRVDGDFSGAWVEVNIARRTLLRDVRFADFNGDGRADVFRRTGDGQWQIRFSRDNLSGTIQRPLRDGANLASLPPFGPWVTVGEDADSTLQDLRFADFNGDGKADIVRKLPGSQQLTIRYMDDDSRFGNWVFAGLASQPMGQLRFVDFTGDGVADLMSIPADIYESTMLRVKSGNRFGEAQAVALPNRGDRMRFADFDGDGFNDAFVRENDGTWRIKFRNADDFGPWVSVGSAGATPLEALVFADFDADGRVDVLRAN